MPENLGDRSRINYKTQFHFSSFLTNIFFDILYINSNRPIELRRQSSLDRLGTEYDTVSLLAPESLYKKRQQGDSREAPGFNDSRSPHERGCKSNFVFKSTKNFNFNRND